MSKLDAFHMKAKKSNISTPPFPRDGFEYKGWCIVPGNDEYFTSVDEVEEFARLLLEEEFAKSL